MLHCLTHDYYYATLSVTSLLRFTIYYIITVPYYWLHNYCASLSITLLLSYITYNHTQFWGKVGLGVRVKVGLTNSPSLEILSPLKIKLRLSVQSFLYCYTFSTVLHLPGYSRFFHLTPSIGMIHLTLLVVCNMVLFISLQAFLTIALL